ncbi:sugar porter family MFS transporter [uncultured Clostridium sp.]|uniref:sugar porter family MFS transporter n=1 Tax=uncultured Clostridium sp. TaxID=59620 RepID=UPI00262C9226|nr:sugar porter family MFS transporter [uncultured Clostridium sp.]
MSTQRAQTTRSLNSNIIFVIGALGGLLFGFDTGIISGASPLIQKALHLTVSEISFVTSAVLIGSCIGALGVGGLADKYGRKKLLFIASILFIVGALMSAFAPNFIVIVTARIILGLAVGSASALTPAYLAELAPKERRGSLETLFQLMITAGILLAYIANLGFLNHNIAGISDWRWMLASAFIPALALFIGSIILPESPRYLVRIGKHTESHQVLTNLRPDYSTEEVHSELQDIKKANSEVQKGGVGELFRIAKPALIAAVGIMLFQQLVGINSVIYYLPQVFIKGFHFSADSAIWISVGIGIVNFLSTIIATIIMDRFPRKKLLVWGAFVMGISLAVLCVINYTVDIQSAAVFTIILIAIYIFGFAVSWGPIAWVLIGEIFPLSVRGIGSSFGSAANWLGNFIVTQFFLVILVLFHNNVGGPFGIFALFSFLAIPFVIRFVPETHGKSLEQIQDELLEKTKKK